jgi:hypothetical protein
MQLNYPLRNRLLRSCYGLQNAGLKPKIPLLIKKNKTISLLNLKFSGKYPY